MAQRTSRTFVPHNQEAPNIFTPTKFDLYTPLTYSHFMEFIETPIFTRLVLELLPDDEYRTDKETGILRELVKELAHG